MRLKIDGDMVRCLCCITYVAGVIRLGFLSLRSTMYACVAFERSFTESTMDYG